MRRKSQSVLEYVLILAVVVGGVVVAATKFVKPAVDKGFEDSTSAMENATSKFSSQFGGGQ